MALITLRLMAKIEPFEKHMNQHENWFVQNRFVYLSEIAAIRPHLPEEGMGLEIGVGSGLFAQPFGIDCGLE
jgi:hypothetical protein